MRGSWAGLPTHPPRRYRREGKASYRPAGLSFGRAGFALAGRHAEFRAITAWSLFSDQQGLVAPGIRASGNQQIVERPLRTTATRYSHQTLPECLGGFEAEVALRPPGL